MVDENTNMGPGMGMPPVMPAKKFTLMSIIALVGAVLLIVSFFLPMVSTSESGMTASSSGLQLTKGEITASVGGESMTMPLYDPDYEFDILDPLAEPSVVKYPIFYAVIIMGVLALVFAILPKPAMMPLFAGIMGIVGAVCAFIGYTMVTGDFPEADLGMGIGLILALVGGILALVGGLMAFMKAKKAGA
ncbi:MAG: hypothetical protein PHU53_01690 [Thermoplasmata archaeon]|nr:hypothetical protein [Thermoplasmata archaeon]